MFLTLVIFWDTFPTVGGFSLTAKYFTFYFILFMFYFLLLGCYILEACSFPMRDRKKMDAEGREGGEELVRAEGGEMIYRVYFVSKGSVSTKSEKKRKNKRNAHN